MKNETNEKENPFVNLLVNIVIPVVILLSLTKRIGPEYALILALLFPAGAFLYDLVTKKTANFTSIVGVVSVLLLGVIGVLKLPKEWVAIKEAAVPLIIGIGVIISLKTKYPLVRKLLYNEKFMDTRRIDHILKEQKKEKVFDKILVYSTYMIAGSFLLSSALNFTLAKILIRSEPGTEAFNEEIAHMTALSFPVIALPSTLVMLLALWYLFHSIKKLTGLTLDDLMAEHLKEKTKE
ncbi:MAG: hypothetical protein LBR52_01385 [Prevotellaceae bacterium]|jgi:hypothetical protein|nr:hypothetical protein [Prevotellaceae bacterium]